MRRDRDDHFGEYSYVCEDWAEHIKDWAAINPNKVNFDLEDLETMTVAEVSRDGSELFGEEAMDTIRTYGIIRYAALDEGDDSCPTCKKTVDFEQAQEVDFEEAKSWLKRQKALALAPGV